MTKILLTKISNQVELLQDSISNKPTNKTKRKGGLISGTKRKITSNIISIGSGGSISSFQSVGNKSENKSQITADEPTKNEEDHQIKKKREIKEMEKKAIVVKPIARNKNIKSDLSVHVVTRWYRSPEIILLERDYGPPIDIWSVG